MNGDMMETSSGPRRYCLSDYSTIVSNDEGTLERMLTCPYGGASLCDGFVFANTEECRAHDEDWHAGPYRCLVCGQVFASAPRMRRHEHFADSEARGKAVVVAVRAHVGGVRVYSGNSDGRRRAKKLARLVDKDKMEVEEEERKMKKAEKERERERERKRLRRAGREKRSVATTLAVGARENGTDSRDDDDGSGSGSGSGGEGLAAAAAGGIMMMASRCREPCCPMFESLFPLESMYALHLSSAEHVVASRMNLALKAQIEMRIKARRGRGSRRRNARTPSPPPLSTPRNKQRHCPRHGHEQQSQVTTTTTMMTTQLLPSPPPTPQASGRTDEDEEDQDLLCSCSHADKDKDKDDNDNDDNNNNNNNSNDWDSDENLPMALASSLQRTRATLRELRCNAPGCWMHGQRLATSAWYWNHLASSGHLRALQAWSGRGGDVVYVL